MANLDTMLRHALPTLVVWIAVVLALDLPPVMAATGVVVALLLGLREERQQVAVDDEPFEETPPIFYI
jgi:hypothetical protein